MNEELSNYLKDKGFTQKSIADALGVSEQYVNALINGRSKFGKKQAEVWANKFGLSASWLLTGEGEMVRNVTNITHNVVNGSANYIVGDNNNVSMLRPNKYGDSPSEERKWAPVVPRAMASMPDFDIIGHIKKQMTGGNVERLYSGTLDIDIWHYIETRNLEPKFEKGDCLGLKSFEVGHEFIREGDIHVVDTKSKGLVTTLLFSDGNGGYYGMATFPKEHKDVVIPKEDVIRIYRKVIMFRY